jgi:hypothetical protein
VSATERFVPRGHEERDVRIRPVAIFGLTAFVSLLLIGAGGWLLLRYFEAREARRTAPPHPLAAEALAPAPPEPRLQAHPRRDLEALRAEEDALLGAYGWVDREAGTVRIPIERAMELLAERAARRGAGGGR